MASDDTRPDPDALVERIRDEEARAASGKLRIYFGSSAGVGKTFAMLAAARAAKAAGIDVVAGVVETHGRAETAALLQGLELLPRQTIATAGKATLSEFDLDAALARRPTLILVDELAHSNVAGSRHPKRWQDVEELLAAGIDVWTTLNVQHLESLNDVVGGITGVRVQETLPDTFFDRADEVVLVDTPADELLARLKAGKVYAEGQAERAAANFFRKGNLMALRELALRRTADRIEDDVQAYRVDRSIGRVWKTEAALLCCVGPGEYAEHIVRGTALLSQQLAVSWHAVYVETPALAAAPQGAARAHPARAQARRGAGRDHGGAAERERGRRGRRPCAAAQPLEDRDGAQPGERLAPGGHAGAAARPAGARCRPDRDGRAGRDAADRRAATATTTRAAPPSSRRATSSPSPPAPC